MKKKKRFKCSAQLNDLLFKFMRQFGRSRPAGLPTFFLTVADLGAYESFYAHWQPGEGYTYLGSLIASYTVLYVIYTV